MVQPSDASTTEVPHEQPETPLRRGIGALLRAVRRVDPGAPRLLLLPIVAASLFMASWQVRSLFVPLLGEHNWRQADTYSVAYNFVHESADFFHPRIDWTRGRSGIMGMEAPIYPWISHLFMRVFGDGAAVMRVVTWLFFITLLGVACIWLRPNGKRSVAVGWLAMALFSPMVLFEFRQVQPDAGMVAMLIVAAAAFHQFSLSGRSRLFALGLAAFTVAVLMKTPALAAGPAMWLFSWMGQRTRFWRVILRGVWFVVPLILFGAWSWWSSRLNTTYNDGVTYFATGAKWSGVLADITNQKNLRTIFFQICPSYVTSWVFFPAVVAGLVLGFERENRPIAVPMLVWLVFGAVLCAAFSDRLRNHWYYALLLMPPLTYFGAIALGRIFDLAKKGAAPTFHERWAAAFVVVSLVFSPLAGGPLRKLDAVPAGSGFPPLTTWNNETGFFALMMFQALAVAITLIPPFRRARWVYLPLLTIGCLFGFARAAYDTLEAFKWRSRHAEWASIGDDLREVRNAVDAVSTRRDVFLVDGENPYYLYFALRRGHTEPSDSLDAKRLSALAEQGVRFFIHFHENGKRPPGVATTPPLHRGKNWDLYCITRAGCAAETTAR